MKKIEEIARFIFSLVFILPVVMLIYAFVYAIIKKIGNDKDMEEIVEAKNELFEFIRERFSEIFKVNAL